MDATNTNGILMVNLGTPDSTKVSDVRKYLRQFLMDERVIDKPYWVRKLVVECFIMPTRPKASAEAYKSIWWEEGSPLLILSQRLQKLLQEKVKTPVALGMRYGNPSAESAISELLEKVKDLKKIFLIPLYPHYAMSSYETAVVDVQDTIKKMKLDVELDVLPPYYQNEKYIDALVDSAKEHLEWDYDHLLFSYHGIPERHLCKADPTGEHCLKVKDCCHVPSEAHNVCYRHQVFRTSEEFVKKANIPEGKYSVSFQSRLGRDPWLTPYTDATFTKLAESGVKKLLLLSPAFVSDCLETLEELCEEGAEIFEEAGGEELRVVPCLNENKVWVDTLASWCKERGFE
ncbi:ferrochelatase [Candidatus Uabimicrobium amorphum]|uniref:Ferrochelatase n=1 Tax=Uabimicrobium amorphum TaxID=2596890 RepID=A0A5S9F5X5_UABAM|nr:ferrochelatase [Candidatus Uabimicrobium amorphum]BBM86014.1 ferrochelatase [Candidatus Uabimicrobium amorphum]